MKDSKTFRPVFKNEIDVLVKNGCRAEDWNCVMVSEGFEPSRVWNVFFQGTVRIGRLDGDVLTAHGKLNAGLYNVCLRNVDVGDNCRIENTGIVDCTEETTFGNGHAISVLNEAGGRELNITALTSAQLAYITVFYRDNPKLIEALDKLINSYCEQVKSRTTLIGNNSVISNCGRIINVAVGPYAQIYGAVLLENGTIVSDAQSPTVIGHGVIAREFIIQKGASLQDGAIVVASLIGEGTQIGKQFSCENCVFFANSEGFHSEACSVFGGPYSVTHHRSTLLIAEYISFYNAGSGTNESNHMYKLGPVHQGILERGCKTGSFSYLIWPSRIGAFSVVIGKHSTNIDTSNFPFSYLSIVGEKTVIVPAMNFFTVGTLRDSEKWPQRDRRKGNDKLDQIIFNVLTPYTAEKILKGREILATLAREASKEQEYVVYNGVHIKRLLLSTCSRYYSMILDKYLGDVLTTRLQKCQKPVQFDSFFSYTNNGLHGKEEWTDAAGLICSASRLKELINDIIFGKVSSLAELNNSFKEIHSYFRDDEWNWIMANAGRISGNTPDSNPKSWTKKVLDNWKQATVKLLNMVLNDASKEFDAGAMIGYGIDGAQEADFIAVRGIYEKNKFVLKLKSEIEATNTMYNEFVELIDA